MSSAKGSGLNHILDVSTTLRSIFVVTFAFIAVALPVANLFYGSGIHGDWITVALGSVLAVSMAVACWYAERFGAFEMVAVLANLTLLHFFPRIAQYALVDRNSLRNLYILFPVQWNKAQLNSGLAFVVAGTIAIVVGFFLAGARMRSLAERKILPPVPDQTPVIPSIFALLMASVAIYGVDCFYSMYIGLSAAMNCTQQEVAAKWLIHFFSGDIIVFAVIIILGANLRRLTLAQKGFLVLSLVFYAIYTIKLGARSGVLRLGTIFLVLLIAYAPAIRIRLRYLGMLAPLVLVASIVIFMLGTTSRYIQSATCEGRETPKAEAAIQDEFENYDLPTTFHYTSDEKIAYKGLHLPPVAAKILDRLGVIDYPIGVVAVDGDQEVIRKYINFHYMWKTIVNNTVIGEPYPEAHFPTANLMPMIYRGKDYKHIENNFLTDAWTIWGSAYILCGWWGGLLFLCLTAAGMQAVFSLISHFLRHHALIWRSAFLWLGGLGVYFNHMSLDHAYMVAAYGFLQILTTILCIQFFELVYQKALKLVRKTNVQGTAPIS